MEASRRVGDPWQTVLFCREQAFCAAVSVHCRLAERRGSDDEMVKTREATETLRVGLGAVVTARHSHSGHFFSCSQVSGLLQSTADGRQCMALPTEDSVMIFSLGSEK